MSKKDDLKSTGGPPMAKKRSAPYVYVTWLTKLLAGEDSCEWKSWFKAHNQYEKLPSDFDVATWTVNHNRMLQERVKALRHAGYNVYLESQNELKLKGETGITLAGKADIVAIRDNRATVIDCKTGKERHSDKMQVLTYMLALPLTPHPCKGMPIEGEVQYSSGSVKIPGTEVTDEFRETFKELIRRVGGEEELPRVPSYSECRFCDIPKSECPARIEGKIEATDTDVF
jgi:CRISPR/Cas system-associated exonuclease Cas4 (RecB family)